MRPAASVPLGLAALALLALSAGLAAAAGRAPADEPAATIAYPEGFRRWTHVSSGLVGPESPAYARFGGIHNIYANPAAMEGYLGGGAFPDGSVLVFDRWHAAEAGPGGLGQGERGHVDVMVRSGGAWRYAEFVGPDRVPAADVASEPQKVCGGCHARAPGGDGVFSAWRE